MSRLSSGIRRNAGYFVVLSMLASGVARAEERALMVDVSPGNVDPAVKRQVLAGLADGLRQDGGLRILRQKMAAKPSVKAKVERSLREAKRLSQEFKEAEALERLREGERLFRDGGLFRSVAPYVALLLAEAKLLAETGKKKAAAAALKKLAAIAPRMSLDPGQFRPQLVRTFGRSKRLAARRQGSLQIRSRPDDLPVRVDGVFRGQAPVTVKLAAGEHFVSVGGASGSAGDVVDVSRGRRATVTLEVKSSEGMGDGELRQLGASEGVSWVIAVKLAPRGSNLRLTVRLINAKTVALAKQLHSAPFAPDGSTWAIRQLATKLLPLLGVSESKPSPPVDEAPDERPDDIDADGSVFSKWWFWTAVGVVAAAGGATAGLLLSRDQGVELRLIPR